MKSSSQERNSSGAIAYIEDVTFIEKTKAMHFCMAFKNHEMARMKSHSVSLALYVELSRTPLDYRHYSSYFFLLLTMF